MGQIDIKKYCKYYKGENYNPYDVPLEQEQPKHDYRGLFWYLESMYVQETEQDIGFHERFFNEIKEYIENYPDEDGIYFNPNISMDEKSVIYYVDLMIGKWRPYDHDAAFATYVLNINPNPLYRNIRGKVLTDFYSEYDLEILIGDRAHELYVEAEDDRKYDDYAKVCSIHDEAQEIEDSDLELAAFSLIRYMQAVEGYGKE